MFAVEIVEAVAGQDDRGGDVVLDLHLFGGKEVRAQLVDAPCAVAIVSDAQVIADERLILEFQLVAKKAIDAIHGEVLAPVVSPFGAIVALDREQELAGGLRQLPHPVIVFDPCTRARA